MPLVALALFIIVLTLGGCNDGVAPPPPATGNKSGGELISGNWQFQYSQGVPSAPTKAAGGWHFDFPKADGVHYLVTGSNGLAPGMKQIVLKYEITTNDNDLTFEYKTAANNTCESPKANVSLYFQRKGDDLSGQGAYANYRFWSRPLLSELKAGPAELAVPLTPDNWINVWGQQYDLTGALSNLQAIGMTFGGGCFAGHGVYVSGGTARFTATSYQVK